MGGDPNAAALMAKWEEGLRLQSSVERPSNF